MQAVVALRFRNQSVNPNELLRTLIKSGALRAEEVATLVIMVACIFALKGVTTEAPDKELRYVGFAALVISSRCSKQKIPCLLPCVSCPLALDCRLEGNIPGEFVN